MKDLPSALRAALYLLELVSARRRCGDQHAGGGGMACTSRHKLSRWSRAAKKLSVIVHAFAPSNEVPIMPMAPAHRSNAMSARVAAASRSISGTKRVARQPRGPGLHGRTGPDALGLNEEPAIPGSSFQSILGLTPPSAAWLQQRASEPQRSATAACAKMWWRLTVVTANGQVIKTARRARKSSAGW